MKFKLSMSCNNAAFHDSEPDDDPSEEIARILHAVADRLNNGILSGTCVDANGNNVGVFSLLKG